MSTLDWETRVFNKPLNITTSQRARSLARLHARGKKRRRRFDDDAEMQFVARQEVVAPCALPVSTSRYLQRLRSCLREAINYHGAPRPRQFLLLAKRKEKKRKEEEKRRAENEGSDVRDKSKSAIDIDRSYARARARTPAKIKSHTSVMCFRDTTCVNEVVLT